MINLESSGNLWVLEESEFLIQFRDNPDIKIDLFKNANHHNLCQLFREYPADLQYPYVLEAIRDNFSRITFKNLVKVVASTVRRFNFRIEVPRA